MGKWIRRIIILASLIMLIPNIFSFFSELGSDIPKHIRDEVESGNAIVYDVNEEVIVDQDTINFKHVVRTEDETMVIYEVHKHEPGWSFPTGALELKDEDGNDYSIQGGGSAGKPWGSIITMGYEPLPENVESIILDFNWYDRSFQLEVSLIGEGNSHG
ncbi:hypothetical protein GMD78_09255 [Ornithinibacillus sp. L9]|uniref:DUF5643 domain-containing protein n=1 Tax=Ornithinibacillus caprae TaxID=2678566 RepID=A0A6N8FIR7_9BACI|nr:DUF5643 domain-containing protein [Ornithinibacillus caprae]MUK88576.1 hypothetical protein [Ornithinibacillus caprae]